MTPAVTGATRMTAALFVAAGLAAAAPAHAQPRPDAAAAAPSRPPPVVSPEVAPTRAVTFRVRAEGAKQVTVTGQIAPQPVPLARGEGGVFAATVGPLEPGIYEYSVNVDGFRSADPANPQVKPARQPTTSILEVPGTPPLPTEMQDVPHGALHVHHYWSKALGRARRLHVYTPPDYEARPGSRYPVLYLLHGSGDNDGCWSVLGRAHFVLDNLIAAGKARPMLIVMPDGHALAPRPGGGPDNVRAFERDLLEDVLPLVDKRYRTRPDARSRAIAGLSMGGTQAAVVGLGHPERFAWIASMSSAPPAELLAPVLADAKALARRVRWLWIGTGKDDGAFARIEALHRELEAKGVPHVWRPTEGAHSWPVWRQHLIEIAPQLFAPVK